jgi:YVTN family beta-propeller protein
MKSMFGTCNNKKLEFNESIKNSKKIKNKTHSFLKLGAMLTALVIIMSSNLPASQAYTTSLLLTVPVGISPNGITFDSSSGNTYVANFDDNTVSIINGATNTVTAMMVGVNPFSVAAGNGNVYVTNFGSNTVSVISGTSVIATIPVGAYPTGIAIDSTTGNVYVGSYTGNTVSVISGTSVIATIPVGITPLGVAAGNGNVYVTNFGSNTVSVISATTNTVTATIPVGDYPNGVTFDSAKGNVYVTNFARNNVAVINGTTNTVTATIPVGANPYGITNGNGNVYVANYASNYVSIINDTTNSVSGTMNGLSNPTWLAFDSSNGSVYVVNSVLNSVSVFSVSADPVITTPPPTPGPTSTGGNSTGGNPTGDTIAPVFVTMPSNIEMFPTSTLGVIVKFVAPTATDNSLATPTIACDHSSGDLFAIGTTPVTCTATDGSNNIATASFNVKVYTPYEASQKMIEQLNGLGVLKSGIITTLTAKLPYSITLIPGNNWGAKNTLNNFINEINSKCCSITLNLISQKPFTSTQAQMFTTEARDVVAATP